MQEQNVNKMRKAIGATAEMSFIFYQAQIGVGATRIEAAILTQAYIAALIYGRNGGSEGVKSNGS